MRGWKFPERFSITTSGFRFLCLLFARAFRSFWTLSALAVYLFDQVRLLTRMSFRLQCPVAHGTEYHKLQRQPPGRLHCFSQWQLTCAQVFCIQTEMFSEIDEWRLLRQCEHFVTQWHSSALWFGPVQLKHNCFWISRFLRSETDVTLSQFVDKWFGWS